MAKAKKKKTKSISVKSKTPKRKGPMPGSVMVRYKDSLKMKVVKAIRNGMTHAEASEAFSVGRHSIPNWLKAF